MNIFRLFERWIDPYADHGAGAPPNGAVAFLWHFVRQEKGPFAVMLVLGGAVALFEVSLFYFVGRLVDIMSSLDIAAGWSGLIDLHGSELLVMVAVVLVGRVLVASLSSLVEEQTVVPGFFTLVRWQAASHIGRQSLSFFHDEFAGRVAAKVWQSGQAAGDFMIAMLQVTWFIVTYIIATLVMVADLDWRLAVLVGLWIAIFVAVARFYVPRIRRNSRDVAEAASVVSGRLVDSYSNIQTLKLFGRDDEDQRSLRGAFSQFVAALVPFTRNLTGVRITLSVVSAVMTVAIAAMAIDLLLRGEVTAGAVAATLAVILRLTVLLGRLMNQLNVLMRNYGVIQNSMEMLSKPISLEDSPGAGELAITESRIDFEGVSFRYDRQSPVLNDIRLTVSPGEKVGLVGPSGAGKSTLVSLLLRFYDLQSGSITIDGQNVAQVTQHSLRSRISVVTQDTSLLHRSIRDNIALGRPGADDSLLEEAARKAHALDFIRTLRDGRGREGMDAHVGERGVKLSGGQRQRIAIARVMLKDAPIVVLDEATSALDSEIEAAIQENLEDLMRGKTVIAIAHRLSTIAAMDRLIVMDKGQVVEDGSHEELLHRKGLYARLWDRQSGGFINS